MGAPFLIVHAVKCDGRPLVANRQGVARRVVLTTATSCL
jgi:hypothetical protein